MRGTSMDLSHRAMTCRSIALMCWVLSAVLSLPHPCESRAHATELAAAENEAVGITTERKAPQKAYALLETLQRRNGRPLPGYVGGKAFHNREHRLPLGRYKEYDVNRRVFGRSRDAERLVIDQDTGKAYYTDDHYRTFLPLN
jgi:guanyl-specific ribonuclease Sa